MNTFVSKIKTLINKKFIGILFFVLALGGFLLMDGLLHELGEDDSCTEATAAKVSAITFTDNGVSPVCSVVSSGETLTWTNMSKDMVQVSSDPHPVHSDNSEISDGKFVLQLESGQSESITITREGTFGFHDHVKPSSFGKIIIK